MSLITNNIIPGNHGRVFGTNAKEDSDLKSIEKSILEINGVKEVAINNHVFPREITVYSTKIININEIETKVKSIGFHVIPKENLDV
ncbi:heavy-metal-associated domain-containing protein [Flavobacterium ovatum]|uniref:heavy-metal-associated domain-containing protein n=1 Tax=Flavobacterium ovatum TaxID=1928857 RepID=UPI00344F8819